MSAVPGPSSQPRPQPIGPVSEAERIKVIDALRGFALFGVLLMDLFSFCFVSGQTEQF